MTVPTISAIIANQANIAGTIGDFSNIYYIQGTNFSSPNITSVTIGGNSVSFVIDSGTLLRLPFGIPAHAAGAVNVVVTNASGSATLTNGFTYLTGPVITKLSLSSGPVDGGSVLGIQGSGLNGISEVLFGGAAAIVLNQISNFQAIVQTGPHAAGLVNVQITALAGVTTYTNLFTYTGSPAKRIVIVFDDSCHLFVSHDTGVNYRESTTPPKTPDGTDSAQGDVWFDLLMAINDGDWNDMWAVDQGASGALGVSAFSSQQGINGSWTWIDPEKGMPAFRSDFNNYMEFNSGAWCNNGTVLMCPFFWVSYTPGVNNPAYPRMSRDNGKTWFDVTGLPSNVVWARACFNAGATVQYIKPSGFSFDGFNGQGAIGTILNPARIYRSADSGNNWQQLAGGPTLNQSGSDGENACRIRCNGDGTVVGFVGKDGHFWLSRDAGTTWTNKDFTSGVFAHGLASNLGCDFGMSADTQTIIVGFNQNINSGFWPALAVSKDGGTTWTDVSPNLTYWASSGGALGPAGINPSPPGFTTCNISPDGNAMVASPLFVEFGAPGVAIFYAWVSVDKGTTWVVTPMLAHNVEVGSVLGNATASFIGPFVPQPTPSGDPNFDPLIGATYRRASAITTEAPAFVGWHRHDFGHGRNTLTAIGVSADAGGLLDHLDMVSTDSVNYMVEGFTQIFDEDDDLQDAWFLDGALVPDSAYADSVTVGFTTTQGIRFTGLYWLRLTQVTVFAFGLDLGDFTVDANGTIFVPYGTGVAPASFDYSSPGAGAYLFTNDFITQNLLPTDVRNGGVFVSIVGPSITGPATFTGYMPVVIGSTFKSDGQTLRPIAPEQSGTRAGVSFGDKRRSHYVKALLKHTIGILFGTDFGSTLQMAKLSDDAGNQQTPQAPYNGLWRETLNDDYSFDSMLSWRITRPYPASVVSIGASIEGQDA